MGIPSAVKKQEAEADAALDALEQARSATPAPDQEPEEAESAAETPSNTQDTLAEAERPPAPAAQPQPAAEEGVDSEKAIRAEMEQLKRKLDVLTGKYNSEVPRYAKRVRELEEQNDALKDELDEAKKAQPPKPLDEKAYRRYLREEENEALDEDLVDFQARLARGVAEEVASRTAGDLAGKVESLQQLLDDLRASQAASADSAFWAEADKLAPGLAQANSQDDPNWVGFLDGRDPVSGLTYREIGQAAIERNDPAVVANLFRLSRDGAEPAPQRRTPASQVKPDTAPTASRPDAKPKGPQIRESEIRRFYQEAAKRGLSDQRIAEKEAEFELAASEGRILFGK